MKTIPPETETEAEESDFKPLTAQEAQQWRSRHPPLSVWKVADPGVTSAVVRAEGAWRLESPAGAVLDEEAFGRLLSQCADLRVEGYAGEEAGPAPAAAPARAIALYERNGFNEIGRRPRYYPAPGGREDAIVMAMELLPEA